MTNECDREWVVISLGKIVQFDGKRYGVCYVTYDAAFADGRDSKSGGDEGEDETRVFKRGFTLPDLTLLRCNLFATVLAVEFASQIVKRRRGGCRCAIAVKHRGAYDLATDAEAVAAATDPSPSSRKWPKRLARHATLLRRLIRAVRGCGGAIELTSVDPGRNVDGDLEFYANCDRDPLEHQDDERLPEGSEEFKELMRAAREHRRYANDLAEVGRVFPSARMRKPTKKASTYVPPPPPTSTPQTRRGDDDAAATAAEKKRGAVSDVEFDALVRAFLGEKADAPTAQK